MLGTATTLGTIRAHYHGEAREYLHMFLNTTSPAEASLALHALTSLVPDKVLVGACNLREALRSLPASPCAMGVDESILAQTAGMTRGSSSMGKELEDGTGLHVTTMGNLVLDIIVKTGDEKLFWNPVPLGADYLNSSVLDRVIESDYLLDAVIDLAQCMGVVWNPKFYFSLDDWLGESVVDAYESIRDLF